MACNLRCKQPWPNRTRTWQTMPIFAESSKGHSRVYKLVNPDLCIGQVNKSYKEQNQQAQEYTVQSRKESLKTKKDKREGPL